MKKYAIVVLTFVVSSLAFADVGNEKILTCSNADQQTFEIVKAAVPTLKQGTLDLNQGGRYSLNCYADNSMLGRQLITLYKCVESRNGEGKIIVKVQQGGVTGLTFAYISQEQISPLAPKKIANPMICRD